MFATGDKAWLECLSDVYFSQTQHQCWSNVSESFIYEYHLVCFDIVQYKRPCQILFVLNQTKISPRRGGDLLRYEQQSWSENVHVSASRETAGCAVFKWGLIGAHQRKRRLTSEHMWRLWKSQQDSSNSFVKQEGGEGVMVIAVI